MSIGLLLLPLLVCLSSRLLLFSMQARARPPVGTVAGVRASEVHICFFDSVVAPILSNIHLNISTELINGLFRNQQSFFPCITFFNSFVILCTLMGQ
jgi:hypothetical protein